jgi:hypothetical protein
MPTQTRHTSPKQTHTVKHFMGWKADPAKPINLNGEFFTLRAILRFVVASTAKAELGALFINCKQGIIF